MWGEGQVHSASLWISWQKGAPVSDERSPHSCPFPPGRAGYNGGGGGDTRETKASYYRPASWARTMASARSATCNLLKMLDT
jgi:hypothetical protein